MHSDWAVLGRGFSGASAAVCSMKAAAPRLNMWSPGPVRASRDPVRRQRSSPGRQHVPEGFSGHVTGKSASRTGVPLEPQQHSMLLWGKPEQTRRSSSQMIR